MDSAIGLSTMIAVGPDNFRAMLLAGLHATDEHFCTVPDARNLPLLLGLLTVWYNNFFGAQTIGIMRYAAYLAGSTPNSSSSKWRATESMSISMGMWWTSRPDPPSEESLEPTASTCSTSSCTSARS